MNSALNMLEATNAVAVPSSLQKPAKAKKDRWHLEHLDALRGIAVLGVIFIHCAHFIQGQFRELFWSGQRGVQLFFVVSAFTLFLNDENRKSERYPTLNFFIRRYLRLAPMYYMALVLRQALAPVLRGARGDLIHASLLLHGLRERTIVLGVFGGWSMADEALFYLCPPFVYRWIRNFRIAIIFLLTATVYNGDRPLAHRGLDALIMQRLAAGAWTISQRFCYGGADWLLIRTSPPRAGEKVESPVLMSEKINLCGRSYVNP